MSSISSTSNQFQNYMLNYNKQSDFTTQAAGFATQKSQLNSLAKIGITNKNSVDKELGNISDALNNSNIDSAQESFNTFLSHMDQSTLSSSTIKKLQTLRDALESGDVDKSTSALTSLKQDTKTLYNAYDASKAYTDSKSNIGASILNSLSDTYA